MEKYRVTLGPEERAALEHLVSPKTSVIYYFQPYGWDVSTSFS